MSNPARPPKQPTSIQLAMSVAPDSQLPEGFQDEAVRLRAIEAAQAVLEPLDMEIARTFYVPKALTVSPAILNANGPKLATSAQGKPSARVRSGLAKEIANVAFGEIPEGTWKKEVRAAMEQKVFVSGGTEGTLGRLALAYPKRGSEPARPVTSQEAAQALERCGLSLEHLPASALRPYPLLPAEGEVGVSVNPHSENGFPVLEYWSTPGAAQKCYELAQQIRKEMERDGVQAWKAAAEAERPWLVAVKGKAKADYYSQEKVVGARMRFYNVLPRQVVLNMQVATQVLEHHARSIADDYRVHTGIGITLTRGGAGGLVRALDRQLAERGSAYVHVGDDSWVIMAADGRVVMFALDCSNFDLTQHSAVTSAVHFAIYMQLRKIDAVAAELWLRYCYSRLVVVSGAMVRRFKHGGPSGMPLQSKVNDVLMDVMITRVLRRLLPLPKTEANVAAVVESEARQMGFVARLEQFSATSAGTVVETLRVQPFLFIGYYFHATDSGEVRVMCDFPRTMAQLPFPGQKWMKGADVLPREAMRIGSISMNLGIPLPELEGAFKVFRDGAVALVERALRVHGDLADPKLRWAVSESPFGESAQASLSGLLKALQRPPEQLWLEPADELPSTSTLVYPRSQPTRAIALPSVQEPTHPPTRANDGRPPPTAVWAPDKPKRMEVFGVSRPRRRRGQRYEEWADWESEDDDSTEDYY